MSETKTTKELDGDPRFSFGPPLIQTPEDATMAYLREQISEEEYKQALNRFGTLPGQIIRKKDIDPIDASFSRKIPDDLREDEPNVPTVDERIKTANEEQEERDKLAKDAEKKREENVVYTKPAPTGIEPKQLETKTAEQRTAERVSKDK